MNLHDLLVDEIKDLYSAEKQMTKALPKLARTATNEDLREAIETHLEETREHVNRLEEVFAALDEKVKGKHCAGMAGIIEEGDDLLEEDEGATLDAGIIAAAQRAEHYEIGAYGTCVAWARLLGLNDVVSLLDQTLAEEKAADEKLSAIAEQDVNPAAITEDTEVIEESGHTRGKSSAHSASIPRRQSSSSARSRAKAADRRR